VLEKRYWTSSVSRVWDICRQNNCISSRGLKRCWLGFQLMPRFRQNDGTDWLDLISNKKSYVTFQKRKVQITTETSWNSNVEWLWKIPGNFNIGSACIFACIKKTVHIGRSFFIPNWIQWTGFVSRLTFSYDNLLFH
jgi:hypothetical protein